MHEPIINLKDIDVEFKQNQKVFKAVQQVSLQVEPGDIYGIVGYSGAGKSTLVRVINRLQEPSSGEVWVNGQNMLQLSKLELRDARKKIGMIFQHFNLMNQRTIADNVAFPLKSSGLSKTQINQKVQRLLELVELSDRAQAYPNQLSGGQKQRVAIARALANDPEILISDEATSALDPKTTASILALLKRLNQKLQLTVVLITHEMEAVKEICNKVAVMENGRIIEHGSLLDIFSRPTQALTKDFINTATQIDQAIEKIKLQDLKLNPNRKLMHLEYVGQNTEAPLITELYRQFSVVSNILYGNMEILQATPLGNLIVVMEGASDNLASAINYCKNQGILINEVNLTEAI